MDEKWPQFFFRSIFDPTHQCNRRLLIFVSVPLLKLQYHLTEKDHQEASLHGSPKLLVPSYVPFFVLFVFLSENLVLIPTYVILMSSRCRHRHLLIFHQHDPPPINAIINASTNKTPRDSFASPNKTHGDSFWCSIIPHHHAVVFLCSVSPPLLCCIFVC